MHGAPVHSDKNTRKQQVPYTSNLDVASVRRVTVAIATGSRGSSRGIGGVLVFAPRAEPSLLGLGLAAHLDFVWGWVARQGIGTADRGFGVILVATPEGLAATVGVTVGWGGTETLLTLVVAGEKNLEEDGGQVEEAGG